MTEEDDEKSKLSRTRNWSLLLGALVGFSGMARLMGFWGTPDAHWPNTIVAIGSFAYAGYLSFKIGRL